MEKSANRLILVGHLEGISFLVLLFVAMPMKYLFGLPEAVRIVGGLHGILFILFSVILLRAHFNLSLTIKLSVKLFALSFVPFGTFFIKGLLPKRADYIYVR
jgi:integral membrane protein